LNLLDALPEPLLHKHNEVYLRLRQLDTHGLTNRILPQITGGIAQIYGKPFAKLIEALFSDANSAIQRFNLQFRSRAVGSSLGVALPTKLL
jgi:hypothetical protein